MDIQILLWLQEWRQSLGNAPDGFFLAVSKLGLSTVPILIAMAVYWAWNKNSGIFLLFACNLGDWINGILKLTFCVYRPWIRDVRIQPVNAALPDSTGYSLPSGHATKAVSFYGGLASRLRRGKTAAIAGAAVLALLVMLSRCYLGVHTPQDVFFGAATGLAAIFLADALLRWVERGPNRDVAVAAVGVALCLISVLFVWVKPYPADYDEYGKLVVDSAAMQPDMFKAVGAVIGMLLGWLTERRFVRFTTDGGAACRIVRVLAGIPVVFGLDIGLKAVCVGLLGSCWGQLLKNALILFYASAVHPMLFQLAEKKLSGLQKKTGAAL